MKKKASALRSAIQPPPSAHARRFSTALGAACGLLAIASLAIGLAADTRERHQGLEQGEMAAAAATRAAEMRASSGTYGAYSTRSAKASTPWGASIEAMALPAQSGMRMEIAFASQSQCQGIIEGASGAFDKIIIDGREKGECGLLSQNAITLVRFAKRSASLPN